MKPGDKVRILGDDGVGTITHIIEDRAVIRYPTGRQVKTPTVILTPVSGDEVVLTPEEFDRHAKEMVQEAEDDADGSEIVKEIVKEVLLAFRRKLFDEG